MPMRGLRPERAERRTVMVGRAAISGLSTVFRDAQNDHVITDHGGIDGYCSGTRTRPETLAPVRSELPMPS